MKKFLVIFGIGIIGVLSIASLPIPNNVAALPTPIPFQILVLINPTILLLITTILGVWLQPKLNQNTFKLHTNINIIKANIIEGILAGMLVGICLYHMRYWCSGLLPNDFMSLSKDGNYYLINKILYGGVTEEIMMRFGVLTTLLFLFQKLLLKYPYANRLISNLLTSATFALAHLPVLFSTYTNITPFFLGFVVVANFLAGVVYGYLYLKNGLESSIAAHIITHLVIAALLHVTLII